MAAQMRVRHVGTLRTITAGYVMQAGALRRIKTIKVMDGGVLRTVAVLATPLTVSLSPSPANEQGSGGSTQLVAVSVTASPAGGLSPFTYGWAHISGDNMTIEGATTAIANFSATLAPNTSLTGTFRVTCTDSASQAATADVVVTLYNPLL